MGVAEVADVALTIGVLPSVAILGLKESDFPAPIDDSVECAVTEYCEEAMKRGVSR